MDADVVCYINNIPIYREIGVLHDVYQELFDRVPSIYMVSGGYLIKTQSMTANQQNNLVNELTKRLSDKWEIDWELDHNSILLRRL